MLLYEKLSLLYCRVPVRLLLVTVNGPGIVVYRSGTFAIVTKLLGEYLYLPFRSMCNSILGTSISYRFGKICCKMGVLHIDIFRGKGKGILNPADSYTIFRSLHILHQRSPVL